jgi:DNA mismatch repair ATPase MutS
VGQLNARLNFLTAVFVNSLFLYDLRCVYRLEKWKADNGSRLPKWLEAISQAEILSSVANFAYNHPHCQFPSIHQEYAIRAENIGHPLLDPEECITNSVTIGPAPSVLIITGANMAGKSTFLRSLGVNVVLALAGSPVYATSFRCPVIPLRSGMRTADSLKDHESYFYAELNRLKSIMDELREGQPLFILLDEILKGTNSTDKQKGSIALVRQLLEHPCLGIVATHDLALGALSEQHSSVHNFCFEASIENDQLSFDYKLKPGLAQNMNATFLMKKMGIIKENPTQDS